MITLPSGALAGVKNSRNNIQANIVNIINSAQNYLLLGTYNFYTRHDNGNYNWIFQNLANKNIPRGIIMPNIVNYVGHLPNTINGIETIISDLIAEGVAVIIDTSNHSKFCISECALYFGSANLTYSSLHGKTETIYLSENIHLNEQIAIRNDIRNNFITKINQYLQPDELSTYNLLLNTNSNLLTRLRNLVLRLNPSPIKVKMTVANYYESTTIINNTIDHFFSLLSVNEFSKMYKKLIYLQSKLDKLIEYGYSKILFPLSATYNLDDITLDSHLPIDNDIIRQYNKFHQSFIDNLESVLESTQKYIQNPISVSDDNVCAKNRSLAYDLRNIIFN